jgi:hypothetical protein
MAERRPAGGSREEEDSRRVVEAMKRRGGPMRGFDIAEATGIAPWWRLKDVLHRLMRLGEVVQTEEGLFQLRKDGDA